MDLFGVVANVAQWLSSGPLGIIFGLIGMGSISLVIYRISAWLSDKETSAGIASAAEKSGRLSGDLSASMAKDTQTLDALIEGENLRSEAKLTPGIVVESAVKASEPFWVRIVNTKVPVVVWADKRWRLGTTDIDGLLSVTLNAKGPRTFDITVGGIWYSKDITVE